MNRMRLAYLTLLCLLYAALAYARPQQDEPKSHEPAAAGQQKPEAKPEGAEKQEPEKEKQENARPEKADKDKQAEQDKDKDKKSDKEMQKQEKQQKPDSKNAERDTRSEMNGQAGNAHPAGKSARIPDDKFRSSFGKEHHLHVGRTTTINNRPGFVYGGYSFILVDAWPGDWAYTDDCYVDDIDGEYFLFDLLHPGMRIALMVEM
jgi:hypothetical protein